MAFPQYFVKIKRKIPKQAQRDIFLLFIFSPSNYQLIFKNLYKLRALFADVYALTQRFVLKSTSGSCSNQKVYPIKSTYSIALLVLLEDAFKDHPHDYEE